MKQKQDFVLKNDVDMIWEKKNWVYLRPCDGTKLA